MEPSESKTTPYESTPAYGFISGGLALPAGVECEYLGGLHESPGYDTAGVTRGWCDYFAWPSGAGGKVTLKIEGIYSILFTATVWGEKEAWVECRLKIWRNSIESILTKTFLRTDRITGFGSLQLNHVEAMHKDDAVCITLLSDEMLYAGHPKGPSMFHIQFLGYRP